MDRGWGKEWDVQFACLGRLLAIRLVSKNFSNDDSNVIGWVDVTPPQFSASGPD